MNKEDQKHLSTYQILTPYVNPSVSKKKSV